MKFLLSFLVLISATVQAQTAPGGVSQATYETVMGELESVALVGATVALLGERGVVPETAFDLTGSREAGLTGFRRFPLSLIDVSRNGETVRVEYTPLPQPYEREDIRFEVSVTPRPEAPGKYDVTHTLRKHEAPADGGGAIPYLFDGSYRVDIASGTLCADAAVVRDAVDSDTLAEGLPFVSNEPIRLRTTTPPFAEDREQLGEWFEIEPPAAMAENR